MGILSNTRSKETYRSKILSQSSGSQSGVFLSIDNFESFCMQQFGKVNVLPDMLESSQIEVLDTLQLWINSMNESLAPSTVKMYFSRVRVYLHNMGIKLDTQDVKTELSFRRVPQEEKYGLKLDDIQKILDNIYFPMKVQLLCQLSSLTRIGEIVQLRKKDLILDKQNIVVKIPSEIAKFQKARTTFFSKEASALLRPQLKKLSDNDLVFGSNDNVLLAEQNSGQILRRCIIKLGLDMKTSRTELNLINTHAFRAYGITKLSRHDPNFARRLAGQKGYLDQYDRLSDDEKLALYQKYEYTLMIDESKKDKARIEKLESEKDFRINRLEQTILDMQDSLKRLNPKS